MWTAITSIVTLVGLLAAGVVKWLKAERENDRLTTHLEAAERTVEMYERRLSHMEVVASRLQKDLYEARKKNIANLSAADAAAALRKPE